MSIHPARDAGTAVFRNRTEAGRILGDLLSAYADRDDVIVLGLPRGGVPVAAEVARALSAPLDCFIVRKLGVPGHAEFAMGAIASGGRTVLNDDVVRGLRVNARQLRDVVDREGRELIRREAAYRGDRAPLRLAGKTVVLVDDGLATGSSMLAAVLAIRDQEPAHLVIAVPAAPESTCREFAAMVDDVICASMPTPFTAVGASYWDFTQVGDDEVRALLTTPTVPATRRTTRRHRSADALRSIAIPATDGVPPPEELSNLIGDARVVLIGESSHGTHEFYRARAEITRWLIEQKGFTAVAAEADWPDAYRVNRFVRGAGHDRTADEALSGFERFPAWMWRNVVVRDFVDWLRHHNERQRAESSMETGFYGLDLYSMHCSMQSVIDYLDTVDHVAAARARHRYECFDHTSGDDGQAYGYAAAFGAGESCERQAVDQLVELQRNRLAFLRRDGSRAEEDLFNAVQNAATVRDAEAYYRAMFRGRVDSWNLRDTHMADALDALLAHLDEQRGQPGDTRIVVWAHNSHVGDARATELGADGQITLGQLVRERRRDESRLIGFTTYGGTVTAASEWGGPSECKVVRPGMPGSLEEVLHEVGPSHLQARRAAAAQQLERLHHELDLADASRAELDVLLQLAPLDLACDEFLHAAQRLEDAEVEVAPVHEGPQHVSIQYLEAGLRAVHRARLDVGVALPVAAVLLQVVLDRVEAHGHRARFAERAQPQVDAVDEALVGGRAEQLRHAPAHSREEFLVLERAWTRRLAVLGECEHEVDVGREVEFAAAQLAHGEHEQGQLATVAGAGDAVAPAEQRGRIAAGRTDAGLRERRQLAQDVLDGREPRDVAPRDPHEFPAPRPTQRGHERRIVGRSGADGCIDAGDERIEAERFAQACVGGEPGQHRCVAHAGAGHEVTAGPDAREAALDRRGGFGLRQWPGSLAHGLEPARDSCAKRHRQRRERDGGGHPAGTSGLADIGTVPSA